MAKISALAPAAPLTGTERMPIVQDGQTVGLSVSEHLESFEAHADGLIASAHGLTNFRATLAEGIADFAIGEFFSSGETGDLRIYKRIAGAPQYADQGDAVAPVSRHLLASAASPGLIGFSHALGYSPGTLGDRLSRTVFVTDAPFNAIGDGVADDTAAILLAITYLKALGGGILNFPVGNFVVEESLIVDFDGLIIDGAGQEQTQLWIKHDDAAIDYTSAVANLPNAKFSVNRMSIINKQGYPLDVHGFPLVTHQGTGLKMTQCFGSSFTDLLIEGFDKSIDLFECALIEFINFTDRNCWTGRYFAGWTNFVMFRGGVINNSSISSANGTVKSIFFDNVDFEAASQTAKIGTANVFTRCRIERLHIGAPLPTPPRAWFQWLDIIGDDNIIDAATKFYWDGSSLPSTDPDDFFVRVHGKRNEIHVSYIFHHQQFLFMEPTSAANEVYWTAPFRDFEEAAARVSGRFYIDAGFANAFHYKSDTARTVSTGTLSKRADGALNTHMRNSALSNMAINAGTFTVAPSDIPGPLGAAASSENVRKITLNAGAVKRSVLDPGIVADGNTVYTQVAYVYLPSGAAQPTRVRLGPGDGHFTDRFPVDGTDRWHEVVVFAKPANGTAVQWMLEAEGDIGDVFYVAFPSFATGACPTFIDRTHNAVTNTQTTAASFDSNAFRYPGREERGTFAPGLSIGGTPQAGLATTGSYVRIGNMIDVQGFIALTGAPAGAGGAIITNLPYDVSALADFGSVPLSLVPVNMTFGGQMSAMTTPGTKTAELYQTTEAGVRTALTNANFAANSYFYFHARYPI